MFELASRKVVVLIDEIDQDIHGATSLVVGGFKASISGMDWPRKIVELSDGSQGLDFSTLGILIDSPPTKCDLLPLIGSRVSFEWEPK